MYDIALPKVELVASSDIHGVFHIEPLEPGFGITVGNALRRVLLAGLAGVAVDSVRLEGVYHEFSEIPGVKEDMTDFILNVKQMRLRSTSDQVGTLRLDVSGVGRVTAADVKCPPEVEIVNPELHLLYADDADARLSIEMSVRRGKGYAPAEVKENTPIGVIPVDAIFSPIRKANFTVQALRIGVNVYDRLVLEVWTDGSLSAQDAVAQAADMLVQHFAILAGFGAQAIARPERYAPAALPIPAQIYERPIEELELSVRAYNCLKRAGITKIGQILEMTEEDLLNVRNFGQKSLDELREKLAVHGYLHSSRLAQTVGVAEGVAAEEAEEELEEEEAGAEVYEPGVPAAAAEVALEEAAAEIEGVELGPVREPVVEVGPRALAVGGEALPAVAFEELEVVEEDEEEARRKGKRPAAKAKGRRRPIIEEDWEEETWTLGEEAETGAKAEAEEEEEEEGLPVRGKRPDRRTARRR
ncbi:MAG: DNA-directed RNA polymerase subunit alpha [Chloroflexi bacterium]|nr:DNA-directed RNA polymerase subunit alpha [Chloroflexota bacterium]